MTVSLLTAHDATKHVHLIVGSNPLAGARCAKSLEVGATPIVIASADAHIHYTLEKRIEENKIQRLERSFQDEDLKTLGREEVDRYVDAVFVTSQPRGAEAVHISSLCRRLRIPVNVADAPNLCTFTLLSTHSDGPLQIGITTSGKGCKLASRIRREVVTGLPPHLGAAIERLGTMRRRIWAEDHKQYNAEDVAAENSDDDGPGQSSAFNRLVLESDRAAAKTRRMRWLTQICEYWPLKRLAEINDADIDAVLSAYSAEQGERLSMSPPATSSPASSQRKPRVILAGSGPGSPHLLTLATHRALQTASFILADKLVPAAVLDLIPRRTTVHIARKFPGNAEAAQQELLTLGLAALKSGEHTTVLRLKQGDPYLYGRGGEELDFFRREGYEVTVLPGITSALSAPLFARVPATHRGVADKVLICTGTGRKGKAVRMPDFDPGLTLVVLMGLHRLEALTDTLVGKSSEPTAPPAAGVEDPMKRGNLATDPTATKDRASKLADGEIATPPAVPLTSPWLADTPCAVIERASCADQRVIRTTLRHVVDAVEQEGSRPPGLFVVGAACEALQGRGGARWVVEDGFRGLDELMEEPSQAALEMVLSGQGVQVRDVVAA